MLHMLGALSFVASSINVHSIVLYKSKTVKNLIYECNENQQIEDQGGEESLKLQRTRNFFIFFL